MRAKRSYKVQVTTESTHHIICEFSFLETLDIMINHPQTWHLLFELLYMADYLASATWTLVVHVHVQLDRFGVIPYFVFGLAVQSVHLLHIL